MLVERNRVEPLIPQHEDDAAQAPLERRMPAPHTQSGADDLYDMRFRALLGAAAWDALPRTVQNRFAKRLGPGLSVTYTGVVEHCRFSPLGWAVAQVCRFIGAPLPLHNGAGDAAVVSVTEDGVGGGQVWTRIYARANGFPQVIHSAKRFAGPTGLEEYLGAGFGVALCVEGDKNGIRFRNDHYFWKLGRMRWRLPRWLSPGDLCITHRDDGVGEGRYHGAGAFDFILELHHPVFGMLIHQQCRFHDA